MPFDNPEPPDRRPGEWSVIFFRSPKHPEGEFCVERHHASPHGAMWQAATAFREGHSGPEYAHMVLACDILFHDMEKEGAAVGLVVLLGMEDFLVAMAKPL